jgi:6-phospho-beta-glucosidase
MAVKIAIIGGGSAYAPGLINAFIQNARSFPGAKLALMDIAANELEIVRALGAKMIRAAAVDLTISATLSQQEAIDGVDYVLTSFRQGGLEARHQDETIPLQHDVIGQETIGPGGFFFAMRTLPVIKKILADMRQFAPGAVLVNYTNPTQIVAEAVTHFSDVPCISICDQTRADWRDLLHALGRPEAAVRLESIGLNHATWSTVFEIDGEDGIEVIRRDFDSILARTDVSERVKRQCRLALEYGRLPNSYMQYYYYPHETVAAAKAAPRTRAQEIIAALPGYYQHFKEQIAADVPHLTHVRGGSVFGDMAVEVLRGLVANDHSVHTLNIPNRGALAQFAADRIVEVPALVANRGATPLVQASLPQEVVGLLHMLAEYQWLAANAIWNGDRKALAQALAANPLVLSISLAKKMLAQVIPLQSQYFPPDWLP